MKEPVWYGDVCRRSWVKSRRGVGTARCASRAPRRALCLQTFSKGMWLRCHTAATCFLFVCFLQLSEKCQTRLGSFPSQVIFYLQNRYSRRLYLWLWLSNFKFLKTLFNHKLVSRGKHYSHLIKYLQCSSFDFSTGKLHCQKQLSMFSHGSEPMTDLKCSITSTPEQWMQFWNQKVWVRSHSAGEVMAEWSYTSVTQFPEFCPSHCQVEDIKHVCTKRAAKGF